MCLDPRSEVSLAFPTTMTMANSGQAGVATTPQESEYRLEENTLLPVLAGKEACVGPLQNSHSKWNPEYNGRRETFMNDEAGGSRVKLRPMKIGTGNSEAFCPCLL